MNSVADNAREEFWTVCMVTQGREPQVANDLQDLGRHIFLPMLNAWGRPAGKRRCEWRKEVVYPGYFFIQGVVSQEERMCRRAFRQIWPVRFGELVATMSARDVEAMRDRLEGGAYDHGLKDLVPPFRPGDEVVIVDQLCEGYRSVVQTVSTNGRWLGLEGIDFPRWVEVSVFSVASAEPIGGRTDCACPR